MRPSAHVETQRSAAAANGSAQNSHNFIKFLSGVRRPFGTDWRVPIEFDYGFFAHDAQHKVQHIISFATFARN